MFLAILFMASMGWNFYQNSVGTEKKIQKLQEMLKKRKL
jgi:hypothetical protein